MVVEKRLSDVIGKDRTYPFILGACTLGSWKSWSMNVEIDENSPVFVDKDGRKRISDPNGEYAKQHLYRWSAGGALNIYRQADGTGIIPLFLKDAAAQNYAGHVALASGLSDDYSHWYDLELLANKEGFEEMAVLVNNQCVRFEGNHLHDNLFWIINNYHKCRLVDQGTGIKGTCVGKITPAPVYEDRFGVKIKLIGGGERRLNFKGLIVVDPNTRGIDFLKVNRVEIPNGEVKFVDCESSGKGFLDREILLFREDSYELSRDGKSIRGAYGVYQGGIFKEADPDKFYPMVPVLETCLERYDQLLKLERQSAKTKPQSLDLNNVQLITYEVVPEYHIPLPQILKDLGAYGYAHIPHRQYGGSSPSSSIPYPHLMEEWRKYLEKTWDDKPVEISFLSYNYDSLCRVDARRLMNQMGFHSVNPWVIAALHRLPNISDSLTSRSWYDLSAIGHPEVQILQKTGWYSDSDVCAFVMDMEAENQSRYESQTEEWCTHKFPGPDQRSHHSECVSNEGIYFRYVACSRIEGL
jgi:hypothetical protein